MLTQYLCPKHGLALVLLKQKNGNSGRWGRSINDLRSCHEMLNYDDSERRNSCLNQYSEFTSLYKCQRQGRGSTSDLCTKSLFVQNLCALHVCISNSGRKPGVDICMCVLDPDTHFIMWN